MSRSLTEIAAREQEVRKLLAAKRLSLFNKRESIAREEAEEAEYLEELEQLASEAAEAFDRARNVGKGEVVADGAPPISDAAITDAFTRATTPQDQTNIFRSGPDAFRNGSVG